MNDKKQIEEMRKEVASIHRFFLEDDDYEKLDDYIADELYNAGYRKQEWISVEERLPEKNVRVLVYLKTDRSYTKIDTDRLDDRGFVRWYKDVTHWMPLPEAPKGGAE